LQKNKIDTIVYYEPCSSESLFLNKAFDEPSCLIWISFGKAYIQKFQNRTKDFAPFKSKPVPIDSTQIKLMLQTKLGELLSDNILPMIVKLSTDSLETYQPVSYFHDCIKYFMFFIKDNVIRKKISENDLQPTAIEASLKNLNFKYNTALLITQFKEQIENMISSLEKENIFRVR
jgi:hypothetical protein